MKDHHFSDTKYSYSSTKCSFSSTQREIDGTPVSCTISLSFWQYRSIGAFGLVCQLIPYLHCTLQYTKFSTSNLSSSSTSSHYHNCHYHHPVHYLVCQQLLLAKNNLFLDVSSKTKTCAHQPLDIVN